MTNMRLCGTEPFLTPFLSNVFGTLPPAPIGLTGVSGNGQMVLNWNAPFTWSLQVQTNSLGAGLGANLATVPGSKATNHITFPIDLANGSVFFRLVYP